MATSYDKLLDYYKTQNESARLSAIDAIKNRLSANTNAYNNQMTGLKDQYQALRNQSEVERYKARNVLREDQANKGQLGSGYGRQEQLMMNTQFGNAINSINAQEQSAKNEIQNQIQQLKADAAADENEVNNQYSQTLANLLLQLSSAK